MCDPSSTLSQLSMDMNLNGISLSQISIGSNDSPFRFPAPGYPGHRPIPPCNTLLQVMTALFVSDLQKLMAIVPFPSPLSWASTFNTPMTM